MYSGHVLQDLWLNEWKAGFHCPAPVLYVVALHLFNATFSALHEFKTNVTG